MALLELPPELLLQIFDDVGSAYFRSDLSRLTVSKQWSKYAHTTCFQNFYVDQKTLRSMVVSRYARVSVPLMENSIETVKLALDGFQDWKLDPQKILADWDSDSGLVLRAAWTAELDSDLVYLTNILKQAPKLRKIVIVATCEFCLSSPFLDRRDYLGLSTVRSLLSSASNLTSLELDLCGTRLTSPPLSQKHDEASFHICTSIAALLTQLRSLRLRMRTICPSVLKPRNKGVEIRLNKALVNLSLLEDFTPATHATRCGASPSSFLQLIADMEEQAQELVEQMKAREMIRILTHTLPTLQRQAFDALSGQRLNLGEDANWDDEGTIIEIKAESESDQLSDLSSDDDE
jgi:hypothetical protein